MVQFIVSGKVVANRDAIQGRGIMLNTIKMARTIDISEYALKNLKRLSVFRLEARPYSSPVDMVAMGSELARLRARERTVPFLAL